MTRRSPLDPDLYADVVDDRAPVRVPTYREDEAMRRRRNPAELLLLNPAATRALTMPEVAQVIRDLNVPDAWRTRFMQGLNVEWSEHGGGADAHSVGALVIDHLNEDPNYYRRATRSNPHAAPPFVKKNLDNMLDRTGKTEDILTSLADIYAERAQAPQYAHSVAQMHQTEHALRSAAQSVEDVWSATQRRRNPGFDDFDAVVDAIRAAPNDLKAIQLAYPMAFQIAHHLGVPVSTARGAKAAMETAQAVAQAVRSGAGAPVAAMPEVAQALAGTGLVPVALAQATQIAEVQTSRGVVEVPVAEAPQFAAAAPAVDPSGVWQFSTFVGGGLLDAFRKFNYTKGLLSDYLHSLPDAEVKKVAKREVAGGVRGRTKAELIEALVEKAYKLSRRGSTFLERSRKPSVYRSDAEVWADVQRIALAACKLPPGRGEWAPFVEVAEYNHRKDFRRRTIDIEDIHGADAHDWNFYDALHIAEDGSFDINGERQSLRGHSFCVIVRSYQEELSSYGEPDFDEHHDLIMSVDEDGRVTILKHYGNAGA